jgi:hypothetical protein
MKYFFLDKLLKFAGRKLDGYKSKIGGAGLILVGLLGIAGTIFPDQGLPAMELESAIGTISAGFVALGLAGKAEKLKATIEAQAPVAAELTTVVQSSDLPQG